jgi:DNA-binding response OmpR family regulator
MTNKGTILVVDDTPVNLKLLVDILTEEGYHVLPADSGELALAAVAVNPPELTLLDIRMPGLDGLEVCRRLKARPESRDIPIIFVSASGESVERVEGLKLGAVDFITKPFQPEELLARVQTHLELRRLRVRLERQAADLQQVNEQLHRELAERKRAEQALRETNAELAAALANVKSLSGLLPICASCKGIRDDKGYWTQVETYISENSEATFTHGLCPDCLRRLYPGLEDGGSGHSAQRAQHKRARADSQGSS